MDCETLGAEKDAAWAVWLAEQNQPNLEAFQTAQMAWMQAGCAMQGQGGGPPDPPGGGTQGGG